MTPEGVAWFFMGEGSISVQLVKRKRGLGWTIVPLANFTNTDSALLDEIESILRINQIAFHRSRRPQKNKTPCFSTTIHPRSLLRFLLFIRPYMLGRKAEVLDLVIPYLQNRPEGNRPGQPYPHSPEWIQAAYDRLMLALGIARRVRNLNVRWNKHVWHDYDQIEQEIKQKLPILLAGAEVKHQKIRDAFNEARHNHVDTWTATEEMIILRDYETASKDDLQRLLPQRTWDAIKSRARSLGLVRSFRGQGKVWTDFETEILQRLSSDGPSALALRLPGRSQSSIDLKARRMGLQRGKEIVIPAITK